MNLNQLLFKYAVYKPAVELKGSKVFDRIEGLNYSQYLRPETLREFQLKRLQLVAWYAKKNVPFYADLPEIESLEDIRKIPFLTKEIIRNNSKELMSTEEFKNLHRKSTGGSTGAPMIVYKSAIARTELLAAMWRGYSWLGVDVGDKRGQFSSVPQSRKGQIIAQISDYINNRRRCSAFSFDDAAIEQYIKQLERFNPKFLYGYSSMITQCAEYLLKKGYEPKLNLTGIVTTSEVLDAYRRETIEEAFDVKVFDEYGCGEIGTIAHECEHGGMHINAENLIVEVVDDDDQPCAPGEVGNIVVTELNNLAMPMLRYKIGDLGALLDGTCPCERGLPLMTHPVGRIVEYLKHENGKKFYGNIYTHRLMEASKVQNLGIAQFQLIQNGYHDFTFKVKPELGYQPTWTQNFITKEIQKDFGVDTKVLIKVVDDIERAKSGKIRVVICNV